MRRALSALLFTAGLHAQGWRLDLDPSPRVVPLDGAPVAAALERASVDAAERALDLRGGGRATFAPTRALGVTSDASFTLALELRTESPKFATALMCREGGTVHYSLVLGRQPGEASFEAWSWQSDKARSVVRVDDGKWHALECAYDAESQQIALLVDGVVRSVARAAKPFAGSAAPALRLGDNLDPSVQQPFDGELRGVALRAGVPDALGAHLAALHAARLNPPASHEADLHAWLDLATHKRVPQAESADAWRTRAAELRARVQDALGLWPPPYPGQKLAGTPTPLDDPSLHATDFAHFTPKLALDLREGGTLTRDGYTLARVAWQTFEGFYATGWLYRPTDAAASRPAVLCPHGHWDTGARHHVVQARCITLAKLGYVVLAVDSLHVGDDRVALSPVAAMTWNNLRGLEVLRAEPGVDAARIGCTGASGGGQQTYYLTALDSGIAAAVPAVMACHFHEILAPNNVHCWCNHTPHLLRAADMPEMAAAFAPRPQLFLTVTGDWTKKFPREGFPEVAAVYEALGARGDVACEQWNKGHDYDRPMRNTMYAFFARHLRGEATPDAELEKVEAVTEDPAALEKLALPDVPRDPAAIAREFRGRLSCTPLVWSSDSKPDAVRARLARLFRRDELEARDAKPRRGEAREVAGRTFEPWWIRADQQVELPALFCRAKGDATRPVAIVIDAGGKASAAQRKDWLDALASAGCDLLLVDVRYTGELDLGGAWRDLHGRFLGQDEGVLAVADVRAAIDAVRAELGAATKVVVVGFGTSGATALFAGAVDEHIATVVAPELGPSYGEAARRPLVSRVLLCGDLAEAALAMRGRRLIAGSAGDDVRRAADASATVLSDALTATALARVTFR